MSKHHWEFLGPSHEDLETPLHGRRCESYPDKDENGKIFISHTDFSTKIYTHYQCSDHRTELMMIVSSFQDYHTQMTCLSLDDIERLAQTNLGKVSNAPSWSTPRHCFFFVSMPHHPMPSATISAEGSQIAFPSGNSLVNLIRQVCQRFSFAGNIKLRGFSRPSRSQRTDRK